MAYPRLDLQAHRTTRLAPFGVAALLAAMLGGCARGGSAPSGPITHPAGDALVLRVETQGGFLPPGASFSQVPSLSLYGDGRVVVPGAVPAIYPGPALPPLLVSRLSESGMQAVLHEIVATGLFTASQSFNGGKAFVADAGTTLFTLHAGGRDVTISVYGLGTFDLSNPPAPIANEELAAQRALTQLSQKLSTLDSWLPASAWIDRQSRVFAPEALRLLVRSADTDPPDQSGIPNQLVPWPSATDPGTFGDPATQPAGARCGVAVGADAAIWFGVLRQANQLTRFTAGAHRYQVTPRPLLPDEPRSCPAA
jgi:hypothetical protein